MRCRYALKKSKFRLSSHAPAVSVPGLAFGVPEPLDPLVEVPPPPSPPELAGVELDEPSAGGASAPMLGGGTALVPPAPGTPLLVPPLARALSPSPSAGVGVGDELPAEPDDPE